MSTCPHARVEHCPLYVAAHAAGLPTCITGDFAEGCAVERGEAVYDGLLGALLADPEGNRLVAERKWRAASAARKEQHDRNLRMNGVH